MTQPAKPQQLKSGLTGREHYVELLENSTERQALWLRDGAMDKVRSIELLVAEHNLRPRRVLELGAGTGAVISVLMERGLGKEFYAVDASPAAVRHMESTCPGLTCAAADIIKNPDPFGAGPYDLVILSHVLEHMENPMECLKALSGISFSFLIAEVPLEDLLGGRLKAKFKDRANNPAGHVQFFRPDTFRQLLQSSGLSIVGQRVYAPSFSKETIMRHYGGEGMGKITHKMMTEHWLPRGLGPVWTRAYHAHHAVLARPTNPVDLAKT